MSGRFAPSSSSRASICFPSAAGFSSRSCGCAEGASTPSLLLVFSQELAALLKAGLPLFQSLDVMLDRQKDVAAAPVARHRAREGQVRDRALGGLPAGRRALPADLRGEPGGGRALRQPGLGAPPLLPAPAAQPAAPEEGDLGRRLPGGAAHDDDGARRRDADLRDPQLQELLRGAGRRAAAADPHPAGRRHDAAREPVLHRARPRNSRGVRRVLAPEGGCGRRPRRGAAPPAVLRRLDADVRDQPADAHAVDAARGRPAARQRAGGGGRTRSATARWRSRWPAPRAGSARAPA